MLMENVQIVMHKINIFSGNFNRHIRITLYGLYMNVVITIFASQFSQMLFNNYWLNCKIASFK